MEDRNEQIKKLYQAFNYKMDAAYYFISQCKQFHLDGTYLNANKNLLFYHLDSTYYNLYSAAQMLLQIINIACHIDIDTYRVVWGKNNRFCKLLRKKNITIYKLYTEFEENKYFQILKYTRHYITHQHYGELVIINNTIMLPNKMKKYTYTGESIDVFDEIKAIATHINKAYLHIQRIGEQSL